MAVLEEPVRTVHGAGRANGVARSRRRRLLAPTDLTAAFVHQVAVLTVFPASTLAAFLHLRRRRRRRWFFALADRTAVGVCLKVVLAVHQAQRSVTTPVDRCRRRRIVALADVASVVTFPETVLTVYATDRIK